jgi:hypothetical protein
MDAGKPGSITPIVAALLLLGILGGAVGAPRWIDHRRAESDRSAGQALWKLTHAESEFRSQDLDHNGIQDFWTGDVAGFYAYGLIPRELAEADTAPLHPLVPQPIPYHGYYFKALKQDDSETPPVEYRQDTDQKSGKVHNLDRFGFVAFPAGGLATGKRIKVVNENNTVFKTPSTNPVPTAWPTDNQMRSFWSKID